MQKKKNERRGRWSKRREGSTKKLAESMMLKPDQEAFQLALLHRIIALHVVGDAVFVDEMMIHCHRGASQMNQIREKWCRWPLLLMSKGT